MPTANREYRDRLFTFIFGSEEHRDWTLSLYNAVNGTDYDDPSEVSLTTIREVLYMGMHNDVSFLIANDMSLYEQQSTYNPNMPLRLMQYAGNLYEKYVKERRLNKFGVTQLRLPVPKLVVFFNGKAGVPTEDTLYLSSSFPPGSDPDIEVRVRLVNIVKGEGGDARVVRKCEPLREYVWTTERIRANMSVSNTEWAVDEALEAMPDDFVIKPYLMAHRAEVRGMLLTEYNEAEAMELFREEGHAEGREEGRAEGREIGLLESLGSLMRTLGCTANRAMELLSIPEEERPRYLALLQEGAGC